MYETASCPKCGQEVRRYSSGYLGNVSEKYGRGQQYARGPHAKTCTGHNVMLEQEFALARANKGREIVRRYRAAFVAPAVESGLIDGGRAHEIVMAAAIRLGVL